MDSKPKTRRRRGERKDKRIQVTYTDGYRPDGKPNRISFYGKTRAEAIRKRDEYKARGGRPFSGDEITVSEWIEQYKALYRTRVNPAYLHIDDVPYNRLSKAIGSMWLADVRESHLQNALNEVSGKSKSTINTYRQTMKRVFERAKKNQLIDHNPAEDLLSPEGTEGTHRALERWESECILQNWHQHRAGLWAMLMLLAGLRRGEMMGLRWKNINMETRQLTVCEVAVIQKNQSKIEQRAKSEAGIRILPICQPLWEALDQTPPALRTGLVCRSTKNARLTESGFTRGWSGFCLAMQRVQNGEPVKQQGRRKDLEKRVKEAKHRGEDYIRFRVQAHDLRHTFATALFDAGVPAKAAQYYLGHADIRITLDLYTHLSKEREKITRSQLTDFLDGWLKQDKKRLPEGSEEA